MPIPRKLDTTDLAGRWEAFLDATDELYRMTDRLNIRASDTTTALEVADYGVGLERIRARLEQVTTGAPGLVDYAREQLGDVTYDIAAEYATFLSQVDSLRSLLNTALTGRTFITYAAGAKSKATITAAEATALQVRLAALLAVYA